MNITAFIKRNAWPLFVAAWFALFIVGLVAGIQQQARLSEECKQLGGVPKVSDGQVYCFSPGVLIK